jgi:signal transduction histidine kinase
MKHRQKLATSFAPADRAAAEEVEAQADRIATLPLAVDLLNAFPGPAFVLNESRQICLCNSQLADLLGRSIDEIRALRPGEAIDCVHAFETAGGCGTAPACANCGAVEAIMAAQQTGWSTTRDCRISVRQGQATVALDLKIWATPIRVGDHDHVIFAIRDTTDERRRQVLERLFFHDVLNTAGGLQGLLEVWPELEGEEAEKARRLALTLSGHLIEEIQAQRDLAAAERGELAVHPEEIDASDFLTRLREIHEPHASSEGKTLRVLPPIGRPSLRSDPLLLGRVLGNLLKNAVEASRPGQTVTLGFENESAPVFTVHNESALSETVRHQIFQRSFTTKKDRGHGIGTYSVKLLTERYLGGQVGFRTAEGEGTAFFVRLP